ncbi:MAG: AAA family ATPase [Enterococcus sp.]|nr:AAA family ATPase [Enterococcus sp.]
MTTRDYEKKQLQKNIQRIRNEKEMLEAQQQQGSQDLQEQLKEVAEKRINAGSEEAFYESVVEYQQHQQDLMIRYQTTEAQAKRIHALTVMEKTPYFGRIDFKEGIENPETLYLGIASLRDKKEETIIIDWRAPIANLYYEGEIGLAFYATDTDQFEVELLGKRQFKIQDGELVSMADTSEVINDDFLLEILDEASSGQMKNIVSTIQKAQNAIIRDTTNRYLLIEGIAGSGKTSALLQRIAFLMYRNRKWLEDDQILLFSPNHLFSDYIAQVLPSLGESEVPTRTFHDFLQQLLPAYQVQKEVAEEAHFLTGTDDRIQRLKNSLALVHLLPNYIEKITAFGPLFRDLKIKGTTYISKEQIRNWYQETNPNLPLYQRSQLLQTKLLKKIGGLEKDELRKAWVKEEAEELLHQLFEEDPHQESSEENERRLLKKFRQQIVRKKFRSLTIGVKRYRFINRPKQYLHFLSQVSEQKLADFDLDCTTWNEHLANLKSDLRQKELRQEDGLLFFLLTQSLFPVNIQQKARFIFIDEMQDFPPAQVALLRTLYPKAGMSLCGDLNQKVFGNETIVQSLDQLFPNEEVARYQLTTSYRSTKEITDFANHFLSQEEQVRTTARNGKKPTIYQANNQKERIRLLLNEIEITRKNHPYWRLAIIGKTNAECQALYDALDEKNQEKIQLITSEEDYMKRPVMIIPAFLAKGLEFDSVFAWDIGYNFSTPQDRLILYTIATRAMHELTVFVPEQKSPFLKNLTTEMADYK